ncbi:hypothetical protein PHLGIDRAFT_327139 [Phlebiopsis gigantea 11061_1 CR5-6]|uniref:Uncharacterized protein n=1 Tax=Phlebiopsis gigantea (strain 11061_1 CR5-6) TaxID=745531 RepID=A0A0C3NBG3_PHLG1|nr:hypothetical protein PHLGIDRAFT_327139 [Phlebiopsis gigantea 11061_1 CR5-6]
MAEIGLESHSSFASSSALQYSHTPANIDGTPQTKTYAYPNRYGDCLAIVIDCMAIAARRDDIFNCPYKYPYAKLALVCRRWSYILRPLIFRRLTLWTLADVAFLVETLQSPVSGWLRECVVTIMLEERTEAQEGIFAGPAWLPLLDATAALKALCVRTRFSTQATQPTAVWGDRALREHGAVRALRHLALSNTRFDSLASLCSLVGGLGSLRGLYLDRVLWDVPEAESEGEDEDAILALQMPRCKAGFPTLEMVCVEQCTENRAIAWMLVAASLRYEHTIEGGDCGDVPDDMLAMVKLVYYVFGSNDPHIVARRVLDEEDVYAFSMQAAYDRDTPSSRNQSSITFVTRPSSHTPAKWTLQHLVIACAHEPISFTMDPSFILDDLLEKYLPLADDTVRRFQDLQTIEMLYSSLLVEPEDFAYAQRAVRKWLPKVGRKVRFSSYNLEKSTARVELAGGEIVLEPFEGLWKSEWIYEL